MRIFTIPTRVFLPPQDDIFSALDLCARKIREGDVVCVTSKIVAIGQGRTEQIKNSTKKSLIASESDWQTESGITLKNNILIPFAGIDESNGNGYYIFWPMNPFREAEKIWKYLRKKAKVKNLGVIITDSVCMPLRKGVVGTAIAHWGFHPLKDYRGKKDIFSRKMEMSQVNIADSLATTGVLAMGEGDECTPIAIIRDVEGLLFSNKDFSKELSMDPKEDIFASLLKPIHDRE